LWNNIAMLEEDLGRYQEAFDLYQRVAGSEEASRELRERDKARAVALQPKLTKATVTFKGEQWPQVLRIGGQAIDKEIELDPAASHLLEARASSSGEAILRHMTFKKGVRTELSGDDLKPRAGEARLVLDTRGPHPSRVFINNYELASATSLQSVVLEANDYQISIEFSSRSPISKTVSLLNDERYVLEFTQTELPAVDASHPAGSALVGAAPPPPPPPSGPGAWPYGTAIVGGILTAAGIGVLTPYWLGYNSYEADVRNYNPAMDPMMTRFNHLNSQHDTFVLEEALGVSMLSLGGAALVGGTIWALMSN
jgi:hypothetical protein